MEAQLAAMDLRLVSRLSRTPTFQSSTIAQGDYKEWRSRINLYRKKLDLQGKSKEAVINLLTSLSGVSWKQVETYVEDKDGFDKVLAVLDKAFKYDDRVEMPRALEKFLLYHGAAQRPDADGLLRGSPRRFSTVGEAWHQKLRTMWWDGCCSDGLA